MGNFKLTLATRPFAKENKAKSWWFTISTLALLCLSLTLTLLSPYFIIQLFFSVLSGFISIRMFIIYHDYLHETILRDSKLAKGLFSAFGIFILVPRTVWKSSHDFHHRNNSKLHKTHIGSFPLLSKQKFEASSKATKRKYLLTRHPAVIIFGYYYTFLYGMCFNPLKSNFKKHLDSFYALVFHFGLQVLLFSTLGIKAVILFSILPNIITGAIGTYLFYVQHNFPEVNIESDENWTYEKAALESSSYLKMSRIMNWFTGNIGYHHVHHLNSRIPFYRLPEVMAHFKELQEPKTTTFKISDIRKCLSLKLWDQQLKKMIPIDKTL